MICKADGWCQMTGSLSEWLSQGLVIYMCEGSTIKLGAVSKHELYLFIYFIEV